MYGWEDVLTHGFIGVLNMSLTACVVILAVVFFRLLLRRRARIFSYVLWIAVLFRLLCPVSIPGPGSLLGVLQSGTNVQGRMEYVTQDIGLQAQPEVKLSELGGGDGIGVKLPEASPETSVNPVQIWLFVGSCIWVVGLAVMGCYTLVSCVKLRERLKNAWHERGRIYRFAGEGTPFVAGIFRTRIYLPESLTEEEERFVLRHEETHVRRHDPLWRLLAWAALCVHWFNPLVWLAFFLSERDMEMACDEAVIRELGSGVKKAYTTSLLTMAAGHRRAVGTPIAFGEHDTGSRIRNVLRYRKPKRGLTILLAVVCVALLGWMMVNPGGSPEGTDTENAASADAVDSSENEETDSAEETNDPNSAETPETVAVTTENYAELAEVTLTDGQVPDGNYAVRAQSIDWNGKAVDQYLVEDIEQIENYPTLPFSADCTYEVNTSMNKVEIQNLSYEDFQGVIQENGIDNYVVLYCQIQDGQIRQVYMSSSHYGYGIAYAAPSDWEDFTWQQKTLGLSAEELLATYYTLDNTETEDVSDAPGAEQIEVYTGDVGDGQSGYVLIRDDAGTILHTEWAHESRAGWNNVYLGELDGTPYLMTLHIEDRDEYGSYSYQVYRLAADGAVRQIAGSTLDWDSNTLYDETIFRAWISEMSQYLENSHLLLSTQDGVLRTDKINESDKYNFETLKSPVSG